MILCYIGRSLLGGGLIVSFKCDRTVFARLIVSNRIPLPPHPPTQARWNVPETERQKTKPPLGLPRRGLFFALGIFYPDRPLKRLSEA